jgi:integrase/recombinase XerD
MTSPGPLRSAIGPAIADYLALKQALGRRFVSETGVLIRLDHFLATYGRDRTVLTPEAFASWCLTLAHLSPTSRRISMRIVRNLCLYIRRTDSDCFVPDLSTFPAVQPPQRPHIFSEDEIVRILRTADGLPPSPNSPLRGPTYRLGIVLLYTAGLRRGELVRLILSDYDSIERTLLIRASKFHKSRLVALSSDATRELEVYLLARRRLPHDDKSPLLAGSCRGLRPCSGQCFRQGLRQIFHCAGVRTASRRLPRVHDLRHTHAVQVLLHWYHAGLDVQAKLPALATSMGHVSVVSTAYYLALLEPVAQAASDRFARHCAGLFAQVTGRGCER